MAKCLRSDMSSMKLDLCIYEDIPILMPFLESLLDV